MTAPMSPNWDTFTLAGIRRAAHTTAGSALLLVVLVANPFGTRDWLMESATDQAQRKADRVAHAVLDQIERNFPVSVTPPQNDQSTTPAARRQP